MRTSTLAVLSLLVALAAPVVPEKYADQELLVKQQKIYNLLYLLDRPIFDEELKSIAQSYKLEENIDKYVKPEVVEKFLKYYKYGYSKQRGEAFSPFYKFDTYQVISIFDVLFYAKDFDTFYKTAVWMREHMNAGQFVYAFTVAVLHREDTRNITLPPPYEIYPQLFVKSDAIQKAYDARFQGFAGTKDKPYVIVSNYTGYPVPRKPDDVLSYFTEDVGLNSFFAYMHYRFPFWLKYDIPRKGETFYFTLRQLLARYYLERLSHKLPEVAPVDYYKPVEVGYYPEIRLQSGLETPARPEGVIPRDVDSFYVEEIENYERRIRSAIDLGFFFDEKADTHTVRGKDATEMIGNVIDGSSSSIHKEFYGSLYRGLISIFGHISDPEHEYGVEPSVLEKPETMLRDPLYYRIAKRMLSIFEHYKNQLAPYTHQELAMPGVKVDSVTFDKLVTFFDEFDIDVSNVVGEAYDKSYVVVRQPRLNHKPFNYHIKVTSDKQVDAIVRVFYGPRFDAYGREYTLEERKNYYVMMDVFPYTLEAGENVIVRSSRQNAMVGAESPGFGELYTRTLAGVKGEEKVVSGESRYYWGFPQRLMLPRGTPAGMPLSAFVIVSPVERPLRDEFYVAVKDSRPLGFPFDRPIRGFEFEDLPNARFQNIVVMHRRQEDVATVA
ncbi:hexamerin-like [Schistocerca piceifrons]|uniref:hexamerin-like n=1 Tax=Schistocerca piceifrons TaxID=274613 RepID=UPI001F5ED7D7|nr:hexamerin-like [Schistocerca piceifrons]